MKRNLCLRVLLIVSAIYPHHVLHANKTYRDAFSNGPRHGFCQQGFHLPPVLVFQQNISNHKPPALRASIGEGQYIGWHVDQVNPWGYKFCLSGIAEGTFYSARIHSGTILAAVRMDCPTAWSLTRVGSRTPLQPGHNPRSDYRPSQQRRRFI